METPAPNPICDPFAYVMHGADEVVPVKPKCLDWLEICRIEPRLAGILSEICGISRRERTWRRWSDFKRRFIYLVGWHAENSRLRTVAAYDLTYSVLLQAFEDGGRIQ